jgi:hypothetical protein
MKLASEIFAKELLRELGKLGCEITETAKQDDPFRVIKAFKRFVAQLLDAIPENGRKAGEKLLDEMSDGYTTVKGKETLRVPTKLDISRLQNIMLKIEYGPEDKEIKPEED